MKPQTICLSLLLLAVLLSACSAPTPLPTLAPTQVQPAQAGQGPSVTVDLNGAAQSFTSEVVAAVPMSVDGPWWEIMPQYTRLALQGYPISKHVWQPQIFVYPVKDLAAANEAAGKVAQSLQTLLQDQQAGKDLPFLPLMPSQKQAMLARVKFQDFKNGKGVSYLTQYANGLVPINNRELIYTYQGLTSDGRYYVAVLLPVYQASLPADDRSWQTPLVGSDYTKYVDGVVSSLNQQPAGTFTPDLGKLDALIQSIEIK
jgi:hypothetical protein